MANKHHPTEATGPLCDALLALEGLIEDALRRGDQRGAEAWRKAHAAVEAARQLCAEMRKLQTWGKQGEVCMIAPPRGKILDL